MTLEGTNTWVLCEPGSGLAVVIDPGPDDASHHRSVLAAVARLNARMVGVLLTHGHPDHAEGAATLASMAGGVEVRALDPAHRLGSEGLAHGDRVDWAGLDLVVVGTPGHTSDSLSFHLVAEGAILTGDTILGRGSSVVAHPDGLLGDYLDSLERLRILAQTYGVTQVLPGHGPALPDLAAVVEAYRAHRAQRLAQVAAALDAGANDARSVVEAVYADVDPELWPAAELSVLAQLAYLRDG